MVLAPDKRAQAAHAAELKKQAEEAAAGTPPVAANGDAPVAEPTPPVAVEPVVEAEPEPTAPEVEAPSETEA